MDKKQVIVITGTSAGIGQATARALLQKGHTVYGLCRRDCSSAIPGIRWIPCDVTKTEAIEQAIAQVLSESGRIDTMVMNAGMGVSGASEMVPEEDLMRQLDVNLNGAIRCARAVIPAMREAKGGRLIFLSSLGAIFPLPFQSYYSVSKAGILAFCDALGMELAPFGIRTCAVLPGDVCTGFTGSRKKSEIGDDIYGGRIKASVSKMEKSEQTGMSAEEMGSYVAKLCQSKHMPAHAVHGFVNRLMVFLYHLLPAGAMLKIVGMIYG